jgi:endonuclease/exonuclease/phosphatase family metal-dependent hydrolase
MNTVHTCKLSLGSLNTHGTPLPSSRERERFVVLGQHFEHYHFDIINLQEVWSYRLLQTLKKTLHSYPYVAYTHGIFGPKAGLVTFSRYPLIAIHFTDFPPLAEPKKKKLKNRLKRAMKRKGVLVARIMEKGVIVCNCHLVANGDGNWSQGSRYYAAHVHDLTALASLVTDLHNHEQNVVISGDFNIPKCSNLYQTFLDLSHSHDTFEGDETPTFHKEFLFPDQQAHCIDYIFFRSHQSPRIIKKALLFQEKVTLPSREQHYLSDHLGLCVEAEFTASRVS